MRKFDQGAAKDRIRQRRIELNISQEELGGRFGMSRSGYSAAEGKNQNVFYTPEQLVNIKYELGLSYDYILEGKESGPAKNSINTENETDVIICKKEKEHLEERIRTQEDHIRSLKDQIELYKGMISKR